MRISIELVPRDETSFTNNLQTIYNCYKQVDTINIPDLLRFDIRSYNACRLSKKYFTNIMPHIRAIDIDPNKPLPMKNTLIENNVHEILIVTGDSPQDMSKKIYPCTSIDIIRKFKEEMPDLKIYAGIDQYRSSLKDEYNYIQRKVYAGADGFFTQPFFDIRLMEIYSEMLSGLNVFYGISPVTGEKSKLYWEVKNYVVFPGIFKPTFDWNIEFAKKALDFCEKNNSNIYFMPIKTSIEDYFNNILA